MEIKENSRLNQLTKNELGWISNILQILFKKNQDVWGTKLFAVCFNNLTRKRTESQGCK